MFLLSGLPVQAELSPPVNRGRELPENAALIERRCAAELFYLHFSNTQNQQRTGMTLQPDIIFKCSYAVYIQTWCDETVLSFTRYRHLL